jgi:hypothetical protein
MIMAEVDDRGLHADAARTVIHDQVDLRPEVMTDVICSGRTHSSEQVRGWRRDRTTKSADDFTGEEVCGNPYGDVV